ncbi:MAG: glycosyltransferase [Moorea sp. SIO1F2]|uniref:glycosyltransferase family 2 protein n=1 Tax=Moorena sp. SIO1F2 TaxID=2607819 RepID=UPI0013BD9EB2|nr:glycosyltransferase [Moorena sp. SIO1F2]NET82351.1 glycosyltransferase [Moorena sp. SIO1F2]
MNTSVSVVITTFNKAQYLEQSVKSVLAQTFYQIECIIVDDGSTDNTRKVADQLVHYHPQIQYFYKDNGGISSARNFGADKATGEWIQFLDADDWIHEDKIRFQLSCLEVTGDNGDNIVFYSDYERVYVDQNENIIETKPNPVGSLTKEQLIQRLLICPDFLADSPFPLLQQSMLFKKKLLDQRNFDTRLKACEDREWVLELLQRNVRFIHTPIIGAYYRKHRFNLTDNSSLMRDSYIKYFEIVLTNHKKLVSLCQKSIKYLIEKSFEEKDQESFTRLAKLVELPVYLLNGKIQVNHRWLLNLLYWLRTMIPNFLLYERYRGPRSRKLLSIISRRS